MKQNLGLLAAAAATFFAACTCAAASSAAQQKISSVQYLVGTWNCAMTWAEPGAQSKLVPVEPPERADAGGT